MTDTFHIILNIYIHEFPALPHIGKVPFLTSPSRVPGILTSNFLGVRNPLVNHGSRAGRKR